MTAKKAYKEYFDRLIEARISHIIARGFSDPSNMDILLRLAYLKGIEDGWLLCENGSNESDVEKDIEMLKAKEGHNG